MSHVAIIAGISAQSSVWFLFRSYFSALRPKTNRLYISIHKQCFFFVCLIISMNDCSTEIYIINKIIIYDYDTIHNPVIAIETRDIARLVFIKEVFLPSPSSGKHAPTVTR